MNYVLLRGTLQKKEKGLAGEVLTFIVLVCFLKMQSELVVVSLLAIMIIIFVACPVITLETKQFIFVHFCAKKKGNSTQFKN